jgi:hypothetical protein
MKMSNYRLQDNRLREQTWRDALVRVQSNRGYHQLRRNILERRENLIKVISLVAASGAFVDVKTLISQLAGVITGTPSVGPVTPVAGVTVGSASLTVLLLTIVIANIWGLVFQWGAKSRDAAKRFDAWAALEGKMIKIGLISFNEENLKDWEREMVELELGEPKINAYLALRAECEARRVLQNPRHSEGESTKGLERFQRNLSILIQRIPRLFVNLP